MKGVRFDDDLEADHNAGRLVRGGQLCSLRTYTWATSVAGEVDPEGERTQALAAFLEQKVAEGFHIETHTDTHAIIARRRPPFWRRLGRPDGSRYVVQVDEQGKVSMSTAEPIRN